MIFIKSYKKKIHKFKFLYRNEKFRFLIYGSFNTIITNIILQLFLVISSVQTATFISQTSNLFLGFYLYGKRVFDVKIISKNKFFLYCLLAIMSWQLNSFLILFISSKIKLSNNLSAIFILPILAIWSYFIQKIFIFKDLKNKNP